MIINVETWEEGENGGDGCEEPASEPSPLFLSPLSPPYSRSISSYSSSFFFSLIRPCSSTSTSTDALHTIRFPILWILSALRFSIFFFSLRSAMHGTLRWLSDLVESEPYEAHLFGGLFLEDGVPASFVTSIPARNFQNSASVFCSSYRPGILIKSEIFRPGRKGVSERFCCRFFSVSLSINGGEGNGVCVQNSDEPVEQSENKSSKEKVVQYQVEDGKVRRARERGSGALNTTKHLWAGAVAAMVSRTFVAPLERLKLEYIVRGEQSNLIELIKKIAASQGLKGFWKGNVVNILRTAPFKSINFYAYDTYRNQLMKITGNEDTTNFERFVAGAAAGITATVLCIPMDTIRTKMVAPGGEALGGIIGAFRHMIQTEGFFSLYKGLVPSIISMAPSGAVFYGVYDILKSAYLNSPEGIKRIQHRKQEDQVLNAFEKLEMCPARTLLYGAIAGACAEAVTYPFEVVRRQLQMQVRATKLNALATCVKIVEQGGVPALYAGLIPSLLQVLPSAAISYFVYEFMKIVMKVESG